MKPKQLSILILVCLLALGAVACGDTNEDTSDDGADTPSGSARRTCRS